MGAAHLGAPRLLATLHVAWWAAVVLALLLMASAVRTIYKYALRRGAGAVTGLEFDVREQVRIRTGDGTRMAASSTVGPRLKVLNIRRKELGTQHVIITGDGIDGDDFRRLRVWLRWGPRPMPNGLELAAQRSSGGFTLLNIRSKVRS